MPTLAELKAYLTSIGVPLPPDFILEAWLEAVDAMYACLAEHYPPATAKLIALYTLGFYGMAYGDKYVSSQTAPSGASQSFRYKTLADGWKAQTNALRAIDPYGCSGPYVPADPSASQIGAMVGKPPRRGCGC